MACDDVGTALLALDAHRPNNDAHRGRRSRAADQHVVNRCTGQRRDDADDVRQERQGALAAVVEQALRASRFFSCSNASCRLPRPRGSMRVDVQLQVAAHLVAG